MVKQAFRRLIETQVIRGKVASPGRFKLPTPGFIALFSTMASMDEMHAWAGEKFGNLD